MARVAVIGGGISGLGTALMLGRRGHTVTLYEQDAREAGADLEQDFFEWGRPRVPQAVQPHSLLAPVRTVLRAEAPDVYQDLLARGAREFHDFDWFDEHPPHRDGDEDLVTLRTRRIVLEAALTAAVRREATVEVRRGRRVSGLAVGEGRPVRVTGVRVGAETFGADLVVGAAGRRSPVPAWLVEAGCRPPVVESHRTGIAYLCRWYRLRADGPRDPGRGVKTGSAASFALAGVFPSDNDTFAVNLLLSTADPTRGALTDPEVFEAVARRFPACAAWLDLDAEPQSAVLAMAGLDNRWTALADAEGPVVTGLVNAGDSLIHTNPTSGHGVSLGLRAAQYLAGHVDEVVADPAGYHAWTVEALRPWFDAQVASDRANEQRLAESAPPPERRAAAVATCAFEDPVVMRARAKVRHLVSRPDEAYATEEVDRHVTAWLAANPDFEPEHDGPTRDQWDALIAG
ncbi:FAD-dependent oxidoreductase [Kitasatospora sp. NPDC005748]|uniref:FAD-dependent oxidoreductase n=1 Tax=Kitasatospora sp. NPDC005748 TaxID=3157063 RepID=UPI0033DB20C8